MRFSPQNAPRSMLFCQSSQLLIDNLVPLQPRILDFEVAKKVYFSNN
jgi:hypothetical protein